MGSGGSYHITSRVRESIPKIDGLLSDDDEDTVADQNHVLCDSPFLKKFDLDPEGGTPHFGFDEISCLVYASQRGKANVSLAVKCTNTHDMDEHYKDALSREVNILSQIEHPFIVKYHEHFDDVKNQLHFIVTEVLLGGSLHDKMTDEICFSESLACKTMERLFDAVRYLNEKKIAHLNIKPENLLLTSEWSYHKVKLVDFGFAAICEGEDQTERVGTPNFFAPEVVCSLPYGMPADVWACGVVMYEILCGYSPFPDVTFEKDGSLNYTETIAKIHAVEFEFHPEHWSEISDGAKDLIRKLLVKDRKVRLGAAEALRHPWFEILNTIDVDSDMSKPFVRNPRASKVSRRRTTLGMDHKHCTKIDSQILDFCLLDASPSKSPYVSPICKPSAISNEHKASFKDDSATQNGENVRYTM